MVLPSIRCGNELYNAYGARQVGTIYSPVNYYQVILESAAGVSGRSG